MKSLSVYFIKQSEHVSQHVGNWHIEELSKVIQVQLLPLQFSGPVPKLLQDLLSVLWLQPGTARKSAFIVINSVRHGLHTKFRKGTTNKG